MTAEPGSWKWDHRPFLVLLFVALVAFSTMGFTPPKQQSGERSLVVYSGRKEIYIRPVLERFEKKTGIKILLQPGKTGGLTNRLLLEIKNPEADIFIATTATAMERLHKKSVLYPYQSPQRQSLSRPFFHPEGYWTGITGRARVIIYNKDLVGRKDRPDSVFDLVNPKWQGKVAIASTREQTTLAWLSSLRVSLGEEKANELLSGLVANGITVLKDNTDVRRAVGKGEFALGLTNSPNFYLQKAAGDPVGVIYPDQDQEPGVLVNPNTVAIIQGGKNTELAKQLVDFLLSKEAQEMLAHQAYEIPLVSGVRSGKVKGLDEFIWKEFDQTHLSGLGNSTRRKYSAFSRVGS